MSGIHTFPSILKNCVISLTKENYIRKFKQELVSPKKSIFCVEFSKELRYHPLNQLSEPNIVEKFGYEMSPHLSKLSLAAFADDTTTIAAGKFEAVQLIEMARTSFWRLGLDISISKSTSLYIEHGKHKVEPLVLSNGDQISSLQEQVKYYI